MPLCCCFSTKGDSDDLQLDGFHGNQSTNNDYTPPPGVKPRSSTRAKASVKAENGVAPSPKNKKYGKLYKLLLTVSCVALYLFSMRGDLGQSCF